MAETVRAYREAGIDEIVVSVNTANKAGNLDAMAQFMERVWPLI